MAKTVQEFYGHLTKQQQVNKKAQIRKWRRGIEHIRAMVESGRGSVENERSVGVGTVLTKVAEEQIVLWVNTHRKDGVPVSRSMLRTKALEVAAELDLPDGAFTASANWVKRFLSRHRLAFRCKTRQGQTTPLNAEQARREFCEHVAAVAAEHNVKRVHNADQTAVCYEYVPRVTVDNVGAKSVWVKCGGKTKDRLTLMLLGDSEGNRYTSFAVMKRKDAETKEMRQENDEKRHGFGKRLWEEVKPLQEKHGIQIYGNRTAWWNSDLSIRFLEYHFQNRVNPDEKILLLWDDFSGHWTTEVKAKAAELNVILVKVPPKYTYVCQPADVAWNKPLKDRLRAAWVASLQQQLQDRDKRKAFRVKPPRRSELIQWIDTAWSNLSSTTIANGFRKVGLLPGQDSASGDTTQSCTLDQETLDELTRAGQARSMREDNLDDDGEW